VTSERVRELLQQCLQGGYLIVDNLKAILSGKARSGKTYTKARLFNMEPPPVPVSTGVAEGAVRDSTGLVLAGVRDIIHEVIQASMEEWYRMSPKGILELLARKTQEGVLVGDLADVVKEMIERLSQMLLAPVSTTTSASLPTKSSSSTSIKLADAPSALPQISTYISL